MNADDDDDDTNDDDADENDRSVGRPSLHRGRFRVMTRHCWEDSKSRRTAIFSLPLLLLFVLLL